MKKIFLILMTPALLLENAPVFSAVSVERDVILKIDGQDITGDYNLITDTPNAIFRKGIRFGFTGTDSGDLSTSFEDSNSGTREHVLSATLSPNFSGNTTFHFKSLVPTIQTVPFKSDTTPSPLFLAAKSSNPIPLELSVSTVDFRGLPDGGTQNFALATPDLDFSPLASLNLSNKAPLNSSSTDPGDFVPPSDSINFAFGSPFKIFAYFHPSSQISLFNNSLTEIFIQGIREDSVALKTEFSDQNIADANDAQTSFSTGHYSTTSTISPKASGPLEDLAFALTSFVSYVLNDGESDKKITIPGGSLGAKNLIDIPSGVTESDIYGFSDAEVEAILIGADIEGDVCYKSSVGIYNRDGASQAVDSINFQTQNCDNNLDISDRMHQNALVITKGRTPITAPTILLSSDLDETSDKVLYFRNTNVTIGNTGTKTQVNGIKTIIIENGNLLILGDLIYAGTDDSLGIILINDDQTQDFPATGNIFVHADTQYISASAYADGGLISTNTTNATAVNISSMDAIANDHYKDQFKKQLIWIGTPNVKKTLGGFVFKDLNTDYYTPWGTSNDAYVARRYDLHFLRRYNPWGADGQTYCAKQNTGDPCDANNHATVIRTDEKAGASGITPSGFSTEGTLSR
jgi:hypothetical protein